MESNFYRDLMKFWLIGFLLIFLIFSLIFCLLIMDSQESDWWTRGFCIEENGTLEERFFCDVCIINESICKARFRQIGDYRTNLTSSAEFRRWQLICKEK